METSESITAIAKALVAAQKQMKFAKRESTNPHYQSKYAGLESVLEAILPPLNANGLSVHQSPSADGPVVTMETTILHESGEFLRASLKLTAQDTKPQSIGSAISYARRYQLTSMLGLGAEDDDANAAQGIPSPKPPAKAKREPVNTPFVTMLGAIAELKAKMPEDLYYRVLDQNGLKHANELKSVDEGRKLYLRLKAVVQSAALQSSGTPATN